MKISPNKDDMRIHLEFLTSGMNDYSDGLIEIAYGNDQNIPNMAEKFPLHEIDKAVDFAVEKNNEGRNIYVVGSILIPDGVPFGRACDEDFYATNSIWCDVDNSGVNPLTAAELKAKYAVCPPNLVVVTGRKPNLRTWLWWKLTEPLTNVPELQLLLAGIIQNLDGDKAAINPARLTRLGGSIAWNTGKKAKEGRVVEIVETKVLNKNPISAERLAAAYPYRKPKIETAKPKSALNISNFDNPSPQEISEMLTCLTPSCGRKDWLEIGMALHDAGYDFSVWDEWSKGSKEKYNYDDIVRDWNSFKTGGGISMGTLVMKCRDAGYMRVSEPRQDVANPTKAPEPPKKPLQAITGDLFDGLIRDTVNDIVATSARPQPELAVLNVLAALGAVFGRRYASPMDTRTNIYTVGVAKTGSGKDRSRKYIKELMFKAKLESYIGGDSIVSGSGLMTLVSNKPSSIMHLDEFGMLLQEIKNKNSASHMKACAKTLTELYSSSSSVYYGAQYADAERKAIKIYNPNLCIYGTTTLESYVAAMDRAVISSGELNRYIIIKPENDCPARVGIPTRTRPTQRLIDAWEVLTPLFGGQNPEIEMDTKTVTWQFLDDRIFKMSCYQDSKTDADAITSALWARYVENVIKVAMIIAIARDMERPNIEGCDLDVAELIVGRSVEFMCSLATDHMSDSPHEKDCNRVIQILKRHGKKMSKEILTDKTRDMDKRQRDNALMSLEERGAISIEKDESTLRRPKYFINLL